MPIRVVQSDEMPAGHARIAGLALDDCGASDGEGGAELRIQKIDRGPPRFLDPGQTGEDVWSTAERWFRPEPDATDGEIVLGPSVTWHLQPHMTYMVAVRNGGAGANEDRMIWPAIRLPSDVPPPSRMSVTDLKNSANPQDEETAEAEVSSLPIAETPHSATGPATGDAPADGLGRTPELRSAKRRRLYLALALLTLTLLAAVAIYIAYRNGIFEQFTDQFTNSDGAEISVTTVEEETGVVYTLQGARDFLLSAPTADKASEMAMRFAEQRQSDATFLLDSYAARNGSADAALRLGARYDPASWKEGVLKSPDPDRAAEYYRQAAEAGTAEAMRKLIALLDSGEVSVDDATERAAFWQKRLDESGQN